jgi:predicted ATPase
VVARVHDVTAGNPLFLGEVVRALVAGGHLIETEGRAADPMLRIPEELRGLIRRRLVGLSTEAVSNLKVASVIGREFELGVLQRISRLGRRAPHRRLGRGRDGRDRERGRVGSGALCLLP